MNLLYSIVLLWLLAKDGSALGPFHSDLSLLKSVGKEILNIMAIPEDLFGASNQLLFDLPQTSFSEVVNNLCSLSTLSPWITPDMKSMSFILHSGCKKLSFPLTSAANILQSPDFDVNKKVALFISGWMSSPEDDYVIEMANAFNCRGDYNFLVLDSSDFIGTLYTWSAYNTAEIGRQVALGLKKLIKKVPVQNIHLIGHSLGAHIVGYAGRYFTAYTGSNITRITGLDPANPCFDEAQTFSGLRRGDAKYIDVIHSNPGVLGIKNPLGDADFYPEGLEPIKPGCKILSCSHGRANEYFIESVYPGNELNFLATRCSSLHDMKKGTCNGSVSPMGLLFSHYLKGTFFLHVNAKKAYGKNLKSPRAVPIKCRKC